MSNSSALSNDYDKEFEPSEFISCSELRIKTSDNRDQVVLAGYAVFKYTGEVVKSWNRDILLIARGPAWRWVDEVVPVVSMTSMVNRADNWEHVGWAADWVTWEKYPADDAIQIRLRVGLAVSHPQGYLHRVAYHVTAIGRLV